MELRQLRKLLQKLDRLHLRLVQVDFSACFSAVAFYLLVELGIADSAVGKISSAVGSAAINAVDSVFTAGEVALQNAKQTSVGKVRSFYFRFPCDCSAFRPRR
jgi:hypothetical protein